MIKTLAQNRSGDGNHAYDIGLDESGDFAFSSGLSAYADIIADKVRTLEGEMQLDVEGGIPYQRTIWNNMSELDVWKIYVRQAISTLPFVKSIVSFSTNVSGGKILPYVLEVETDIGSVTVS